MGRKRPKTLLDTLAKAREKLARRKRQHKKAEKEVARLTGFVREATNLKLLMQWQKESGAWGPQTPMMQVPCWQGPILKRSASGLEKDATPPPPPQGVLVAQVVPEPLALPSTAEGPREKQLKDAIARDEARMIELKGAGKLTAKQKRELDELKTPSKFIFNKKTYTVCRKTAEDLYAEWSDKSLRRK